MGAKFHRARYQAQNVAADALAATRDFVREKRGLPPVELASLDSSVLGDGAAAGATTGDIDEDLFEAAKKDDVRRVERLLRMGANPLEDFGDLEKTAFHVCMSAAVASRLTKSLPGSVQEDLSEIRDGRGNTPLHAAAANNRTDALLGLVECGFDITWTNDAGRTPEHTARVYHWDDVARLLHCLAARKCWCEIDLEKQMQLYLQVYSYREPCFILYGHLSDQKREDMEEEREIRKKLNPLLESRDERKRWAAEKEAEKAKLNGGEPDIHDMIAKAMRDTDKMMRRQARRDRGEDVDEPDSADGSDSDSEDEAPRNKRSGGKKKESLKVRIKNLEAKLAEVTNPGRWRAFENTMGYPQDVQDSAEALIVPALAMHLRVGGGCPGRVMECRWCHAIVPIADEQEHVTTLCPFAKQPCDACGVPVANNMLAQHKKVDCLSREWVHCPNCHVELRSAELRSHLKRSCSERKQRCRYCRAVVRVRLYLEHQKNECPDTLVKCPVRGCDDVWYHCKSQADLARRHERAHLQKHWRKWTPEEVEFWLQRTFPFFGDFLLRAYGQRIVDNRISGKQLHSFRNDVLLRRMLQKVVGMPEDHAYTTAEAILGRTTAADEMGVERPKKTRAGAYLNASVAAGTDRWKRESPGRWTKAWVAGRASPRSSPPVRSLGSPYRVSKNTDDMVKKAPNIVFPPSLAKIMPKATST